MDVGPGLLAEGRADDFDHLAGGDGADRAALAQRKSVAKPRQESGGVEIARSRGVHALGRGHDAHVYDLLALFDQRAFRADLHDGQFAHLRNGLEGVQRLGLAGEGLGLVLVGENDVDVLAHQPAQEFEVLGHDVEAGQVDGDLQAALLGRTGGLEDQVVVLHQITFDVEAVVPLENRRLDLSGREFERRAEVGDHRALAVGGDQRHAFARTFPAPENDRLDAQVVQRLHEEVARGVGAHLADEPDAATQLRHGADGVAGRSSEREGIGESGHRFRNFGLEPGVHEAHRAFG